jgi:uncharacterized protein YbaR (Trm112 family)
MQLLLTDRLTCPRCGPTFGLILLAHRIEDRAVHEGRLGCPNCRDAYEIAAGFADLRAPPRGELPEGLAGRPPLRPDEPSERVVALLGVTGGPGTIALAGEAARHASAAAAAGEDLQIVGIDADLRHWPEQPRVSRVVAEPGFPFFGAMLRAVAVDGRLGAAWLAEAARVVVPKGRVVVVRAPEDVESTLRAQGLEVLASDAGTVVAARG